MKANWPISLLIISTLAGCASNRSTVGDGTFQKRRLRTGWHMDLGLRDAPRPPERVARMEHHEPAILSVRTVPSAEPLAYAGPHPLPAPDRALQDDFMQHPIVEIHGVGTSTFKAPDSPTTTTSEGTIGKWNPWAVPAFVLALGTVAYAILGTSEVIVVLAVVATLVMATIAVRKGRTYEWRGKGFAIAALMIGALAGLITLIALLGAA